MELALSVVALVVAGVAVGLAWAARSAATQADERAEAARRDTEAGRAEAENLARTLATARDELAALRHDLDEARTAVATAPPPLPRARARGLDDLREQLRAAQAEEDEDEE